MNCPVCGSKESTLLYKIDSEKSVSHLLKRSHKNFALLQNHIKQLWKSDESTIQECSNCGLVYATPFLAGDELYYNLSYNDNFSYPKWKWEYDVTLKELESVPLENLKILEIGAGTGEFLKIISQKKIQKQNIHATEYSNFGKSIIEKQDITCFSLDIRDKEFQDTNNKYDIICMFQVLEHLDKLHEFFNALNLITNNGASLFIAVPNNIQRKFYEENGIIQDVSPMHLTRWNVSSMNILASKHGWSIINHLNQPQKASKNIKDFFVNYLVNNRELSQKLDSIHINPVRKFIKLFFYVAIFFKKLRYMPKLIFSRKLGVSQWFYLKKN